MIEILDGGVLATVQDAGRPGHAHIGVPHSGWVDPPLARHCNLLVGNHGDAPLIETVGGLTVRAREPVTIASDAEPLARTVQAGEEVTLQPGGRPWHYLALRGGIDVPPVLGSVATDTLSGLGPAVLRPGDRLALGPEPSGSVVGEASPVRSLPPEARIFPGPRLDWFAAEAWGTLTSVAWTVGVASRVGVRLSGPAVERVRHVELPSEGLVRGAIQVPADGAPIMMLADHPTTGGYPVIAVVHPDDVPAVAQTPPGVPLRLRSA